MADRPNHLEPYAYDPWSARMRVSAGLMASPMARYQLLWNWLNRRPNQLPPDNQTQPPNVLPFGAGALGGAGLPLIRPRLPPNGEEY